MGIRKYNFINKMKIVRRNTSSTVRVYNHLVMDNGISLSIQASGYHYCLPRDTVKLDEYVAFELAIMKDGDFADFDNIGIFERSSELREYFDGAVYSYVPKDLVEDLYNHLNKKDVPSYILY